MKLHLYFLSTKKILICETPTSPLFRQNISKNFNLEIKISKMITPWNDSKKNCKWGESLGASLQSVRVKRSSGVLRVIAAARANDAATKKTTWPHDEGCSTDGYDNNPDSQVCYCKRHYKHVGYLNTKKIK